ncbi:hypothetical protein KM043_009412 [Ampulex compressa]|nr:hypothetical protein KM043_009412 [Ampulex compressa]
MKREDEEPLWRNLGSIDNRRKALDASSSLFGAPRSGMEGGAWPKDQRISPSIPLDTPSKNSSKIDVKRANFCAIHEQPGDSKEFDFGLTKPRASSLPRASRKSPANVLQRVEKRQVRFDARLRTNPDSPCIFEPAWKRSIPPYVGRAHISSFLGNHRPEVGRKIISPKAGYVGVDIFRATPLTKAPLS